MTLFGTPERARLHDPARGPFEPHTPRGTRRDMSPPPPPPERKRLQSLCLDCGEDVAVHDGRCLSCAPPIRVSDLKALASDLRELDVDLSEIRAAIA